LIKLRPIRASGNTPADDRHGPPQLEEPGARAVALVDEIAAIYPATLSEIRDVLTP
jgi:hypothetical protein